jgi:hypothetical protein
MMDTLSNITGQSSVPWRDFDTRHNELNPLPAFILSNTRLIGCEENQIGSNSLSNQERGTIVVFALASIVASLSVALTIFYNPKLRIHPSKLIGYMCICEAASCFSALIWVINPLNYICYFGLHYLWHWTTG